MEKIWAIILSAGRGTRMNMDICKQYIPVNDKPVLFYTLKAFEKSKVDNIVLVVGENDISYVKNEIIEKYGIKKIYSIVAGGKERYDSVINGLEIINEGKVLVHDGARPLVEELYINKMIDELSENDACIAAVRAKDTIKIIDESGYVKETPERNKLWQIQTPQGFSVSVLKEAYNKMKEYGDDSITDDSMVVEKYTDRKVKILECSYKNIKITTPEDLEFMKQIII